MATDQLTIDTVIVAAVSSAVFFVVWQALEVAQAYLETTPEGQPGWFY